MRGEQTNIKITLLLVKDWDGFQRAIRENRNRSDRRVNR